MPTRSTRWGIKWFYDEDEVYAEFGVKPETLAVWRMSEPLLTIRLSGKIMYEEQSLRACIARHQGDRR